MSFDFQLAWSCPHLAVEEVVSLGDDRRSLDIRQPVAGAGTVRILANDEVFIPQGGLLSVAQVPSSESGPYDLGISDTNLAVHTSAGTDQFTFSFNGPTRIRTDALIHKLLGQNPSFTLIENINGHLTFSDTGTVGPDSFVKVEGTAAVSLGFGDPCEGNNRQYSARGKRVYPGWSLQKREDEITNRFPKFNYPVKNNPIFKVTYATMVQRCLRCGASYIENDYRFDQGGQALTIENENLLYQVALKILLTDRGSNPFHTWYGSLIRSRIGQKALGMVAASINEDVRTALTKLQTLQQEQGRYQQVTFKERIYNVLSVKTLPADEDLTTYTVDIVVQNASAEPVALSIVYTVPDVVALLQGNGQTQVLGNEQAGLLLGS